MVGAEIDREDMVEVIRQRCKTLEAFGLPVQFFMVKNEDSGGSVAFSSDLGKVEGACE